MVQAIENETLAYKIKRSLCVVVTKINDISNPKRIASIKRHIALLEKELAEHAGQPDEEVEKDLQDKQKELKALMECGNALETARLSLKSFAQESPVLKTIKNMRNILESAVEEGRVCVFTAPTQLGDKMPGEAVHIRRVIHDLSFLPVEEASIGVRVSKTHESEVIRAVQNELSSFSVLDSKLSESIRKDLEYHLKVNGTKFRNHTMQPPCKKFLIFADVGRASACV